MNTRTKTTQFCVITAMLLLTATVEPPVARGGFVTTLAVTTTLEQGGLTFYQYTLTNTLSSTLPAVEFTLSVDPSAAIQSITGPAGWTITYNADDTVVNWASPSSATAIQPGNSGAFSFYSPEPPVNQDYLILGIDEFYNVGTNTGLIASPGPSIVPEPSSIVLYACGFVLIFIYVKYKQFNFDINKVNENI